MNSLPGNPHVHPGPQIASPETINNDYIAAEGITDTTVMLSELSRNTDSTLALAYEQRTANLIAWCTANGSEPNAEMADILCTRLGLDGAA